MNKVYQTLHNSLRPFSDKRLVTIKENNKNSWYRNYLTHEKWDTQSSKISTPLSKETSRRTSTAVLSKQEQNCLKTSIWWTKLTENSSLTLFIDIHPRTRNARRVIRTEEHREMDKQSWIFNHSSTTKYLKAKDENFEVLAITYAERWQKTKTHRGDVYKRRKTIAERAKR